MTPKSSASKLAALGFGVALTAGAATGILLNATGSAGAATAVVTPDTATTDDGTTDDTTTDDSTTDPTTDRATKFRESLQGLVDDGTLTQAQLDSVISTMQANRPERGDGGGRHGRGHFGRGLDTVATTIGITVEELRTGLQSGQSIAQIAEANGSSAQAVIDALVADATTRITDMVNRVPGADDTGDDSATPSGLTESNA